MRKPDGSSWFFAARPGSPVDVGKEGKTSLPLLLGALASPSQGLRVAAALSIGDLGVRVKAARLLGRSGVRSEGIADAYREGLNGLREGADWIGCEVPRDAARGLAEMGPAARGAVPDLEGCLEMPDQDLRVLAANALWKVAGLRRLEPLVEALEAAADEPVPLYGSPARLPPALELGKEAASTLAAMGPRAAGALPALERAIASPGARPIRGDLEQASRTIGGPR